MELMFGPNQDIGQGVEPNAVHTSGNTLQVVYSGNDGKLFAKDAPTLMGQWNNLVFGQEYLICNDNYTENMKLKHTSTATFVVWKNSGVKDTPNSDFKSRHRIALWETRKDLSKYLANGSIEFRLDDPVTKLDLNLENPNYVLSGEDDTLLEPGTSVMLFFRSGDSNRYGMGKYFIDRNSMSVTESSVSISCRNAIGKLLKDQTFDDHGLFPVQNLQDMGAAMLESFGVTNYFVSDTAATRGMRFPPDMNGLEGFQELIKTIGHGDWKISEDMTGCVGFGYGDYGLFDTPSTYEFQRDHDVFSRSVERDDTDAYSRVCVFNKDRTIEVYKPVDFKFVMGMNKTLHAPIADGTTKADAEAYATTLASLLANVGTIETFTGPFKPHLSVGDNAQIIGNFTSLLGLITSIKHTFGKNGFETEFVVDSGSTANKTRVSDYIAKIAGKNVVSSQAVRLY